MGISGILQRGCESKKVLIWGAEVSGVNLVSSEKLHEFEIICPKSGVHSHPTPTFLPPCIQHSRVMDG